ncbi:hypothetical protein HXX76_002058 [Chlamydomonas incerta]|uniref:Uncharacterized protein n=1 Tax=Chlamydomonas incerta TaxID=51695 RepID=A0A835WAC5_CHLIN|nr:hypothetical protein HXX76_002058 [Chlamydomonas incerta]|eukprot:KAG2443710.1 hypothetical protein HXX76_002058 [Chlamydomonas incerta]
MTATSDVTATNVDAGRATQAGSDDPPADRIRIRSATAVLSGDAVDLGEFISVHEARQLLAAPASARRDLSLKERCALRHLVASSNPTSADTDAAPVAEEASGMAGPAKEAQPAAAAAAPATASHQLWRLLADVPHSASSDFLRSYDAVLPSCVIESIRLLGTTNTAPPGQAGTVSPGADSAATGAAAEAARRLAAATACRDAFVAAAQHGDTDMLTLLAADETFRRVTSVTSDADAKAGGGGGGGNGGQRIRDILLSDLVWAVHRGTVQPQVLTWMFGESGAAATSPFADWRGSGAPYLAAAVAMLEQGQQQATTAAPPGQGGAVADDASTVPGGTHLLEALHRLGFEFAPDGATLLTAVHLASTGRASLRAVLWLVEKGCPAGEPGLAYACAMGLGPAVSARAALGLQVLQPHPALDEARAVLAALNTKGVPLGAAALEDLWRLPRHKYYGYVAWLAANGGYPGPEEGAAAARERLYLQALQLDGQEHLGWRDGRAAELRRLKLAPPSGRRWVSWVAKPPECFAPGAAAQLRSRRVLDPLQDALAATPPVAVAAGGPRFAHGGLPGVLSDAYHGGANAGGWATCTGAQQAGVLAAELAALQAASAKLAKAVEDWKASGVVGLYAYKDDAQKLLAGASPLRIGKQLGDLAAAAAAAELRAQQRAAGAASEADSDAGGQLWLLRVCGMLREKVVSMQAALADPKLAAPAHLVLALEAAQKAKWAASYARDGANSARTKRAVRKAEAHAQAARAESAAQESSDNARRAQRAYDDLDFGVLAGLSNDAQRSAATAETAQTAVGEWSRSPPPSPRVSYGGGGGGGCGGGGCSGGGGGD